MANAHAPRPSSRHRMPPGRVSDAKQVVPQVLLRAVAALVATALLIVGYAVLTGREPSAQAHDRVAVAERLIQIKARADGGTIITGTDGKVLADVAPNEKGFLTVIRRAMEFERHRNAIDTNPPVALIRFADGRIGLRDDATDWKIGLIGFGQDNARAFAELIQ